MTGGWRVRVRGALARYERMGLVRRGMAAVLVMLALVTSACTPPPLGKSAIAVSRALARTERAGSAAVSIDLLMASSRLGPLAGTARGVVNFADRTGRMELYGFGLPERSATEVVFTSSAIYMKLPTAARLKGQGNEPWLGLLLSDLNAVSTAQAGFVFQAESVNALYLLDAVSLGATGFERSPSSGRTAPYVGSVDLATAQRYSNGLDAMVLSQQTAFTGISVAPVDVWLDHAGRIRRLRLVLDPTQAPSGSRLGGKVTITVSLSRFGVAAPVAAPVAGQVANLDVILENLSGGEMGEPPGETPGQ